MARFRLPLAVTMMLILAGCAVRQTVPEPTGIPLLRTQAPATEAAMTATMPAPTAEPTVTPVPSTADDPRGEEAIVILQPGNGSRVTSPVRVAGIADPTFEQNLVVRLILDDGSELALAPTIIAADIGQRGSYSLDLAFDVSEERQGFIQVYDASARDGGILHLNSVAVMLAPSGATDIRIATPAPERIAISQPLHGETLAGGSVHVAGFALASFEQTLLVELLDADGDVLASQPVTVNAPDIGQPGPFSADLTYDLTVAGPGRLVVRDISPAHGDDAHRASVEVRLEP